MQLAEFVYEFGLKKAHRSEPPPQGGLDKGHDPDRATTKAKAASGCGRRTRAPWRWWWSPGRRSRSQDSKTVGGPSLDKAPPRAYGDSSWPTLPVHAKLQIRITPAILRSIGPTKRLFVVNLDPMAPDSPLPSTAAWQTVGPLGATATTTWP